MSTPPRTWFVTGASSGLGAAITRAALAAGDVVVAAARRPLEPSDRLVPVQLDVADVAAVERVAAEVLEHVGGVDVLVNCAGRAHVGAVEETTDAELRDLLDVHLLGPAALVRALLPGMRERGRGAVVQVSSMGGRLSFPGVGAYSASKFALEGLSEALAAEVAPFGVRVLVVEPGSFRTGLHSGAMTSSEELSVYADVVGPGRAAQADMEGREPGDPDRAAAAVLAALDADDPPLRLVLGTDAVEAVTAAVEAQRRELAAWEHVGRGTDISADV